jgi:hypothetical protein
MTVHQVSFLISRQQLKRIKSNLNFAQFLSNDRYSMKCTDNTDIYLHSGMTKMICVSEFDQNLIHHVPNIYTTGKLGRDKLGSDDARMNEALKRLLQ